MLLGHGKFVEYRTCGAEMLRALGEQLRLMAADPGNNFASTIRRLAGPREAARCGQPLRRMILSLPDMAAQLRRWSDRSGLSARAIRMQRFALDYLYDPIDFLSTSDSGLFRYLDDAYLIARIYQLTLMDCDASGVKNRGKDRALTKSVADWIAAARRLLPNETARIDELLDEVARGRASRKPRMRRRSVRAKGAGRRPERKRTGKG